MLTASRSEESIFAEALEQPTPQRRAAFLDEACRGSAGLRACLENLLKSHVEAGSFLDGQAAATVEAPTLVERPGTFIGPYKLLQKIGEGGMGVVYMAEQESPVRRRVALKIIKPGMDSAQVIARFEAERQALAMMDHQNIARVLDAGAIGEVRNSEFGMRNEKNSRSDVAHGSSSSTPNSEFRTPHSAGRPYFVMELVHGVPLTKFCDEGRLTPRERLELFVQVCHAIQHAHQKGVIHRDIKPSNVLVTMYDDKPVPKIIDFGVAKAMEQRLTERTLFTQYGTLVGTFEYMSPEQAEMNAFGVDTRSDIYSLGVLLYELLTGSTPLEKNRLRQAALDELVRLIKEEEPLRPSARLSSSGTLTKVAAACRTEPARLPQMLRGELDWIIMKCLEKDRTRRYETANGLARDVERFLRDEPVEACPPSLTYRLRKAFRKHRGMVLTASSFAGLLIVGVVVSTWMAATAMDALSSAEQSQIQAETALAGEREARQDAERAKQEAEGFNERLRSATQIANDGADHYYRGNWAAAYECFAKAEEIEDDLLSIHANRAMLLTRIGLWDRAVADYDARFRLATRTSARTLREHALLKYYVGDEAGYRLICQEILQQYGGTSHNDSQWCVLAVCLLSPKPVGDPADLVRRGENLVKSQYSPWNLRLAGLAHFRAGDFHKAAARSREAIEYRQSTNVAGVNRMGYCTLAMAQHQLGQSAEAVQSLAQAEAVLGEWAQETLDGQVGSLPQLDWDLWVSSLLFWREAKRLITGNEPVEDPRLTAIYNRALDAITQGDAQTFMKAGRSHVQRGEWDAAAREFAKVLDQLPRGFRASSAEMRMCVEMVETPHVAARVMELRPQDPRPWSARGRLRASAREWSAASEDFAQALELRTRESDQAGGLRLSGPQRGRGALLIELAALRMLAGDEAGHRAACETAWSERNEITDHVSSSMYSRALTLKPDAAADPLVAVDLACVATTKEPGVAWFLFGLGAAEYRAGHYEEAVSQLEESLRVHPDWAGRGQNFAMLAMSCQQLGQREKSQEWLDKAQESLEEMEQTIARNKYGYAASDYLSDWLTLKVLLPEAEMLVAAENTP